MAVNPSPAEAALAAARAAAEELRAEQQVRTDFLLGLVHEFRNPLTAMMGALDILKDTLGDRLTAKDREFFDIVDVSLARLNQMLDEMLEFTALEGREVALAYEPTDMVALVREVLAEFEPRARIYGVKLNDVVSPQLVRVACDAERIRRALANLVSNAVKYNRPGGEVTVTLAPEGDVVRVAVADTGAGIPPEDYAKIFTRFHRGADVRKKGIVGTGLGLAIAKNIVEMHGGEITFASRPGDGTTFTCTLPRRPAVREAKDGP